MAAQRLSGKQGVGGARVAWRWLAMAALAASALAGCAADTGSAPRAGPRLTDVNEAIRQCGQNQQRMRLVNPNAPASGQGSYTNLQDSDGRRQTEMSDPSGGGGWFRCGS